MTEPTKATPQAILDGVKDQSMREVPAVPRAYAQFMPFFFLFTERGPEGGQMVSGNGAKLYGTKTFDKNSPYYTHGTVLANAMLANGPIYIERLKPEGAATAFIRVSVEVIATDLPLYARNADGSIQYTPGEFGPEPVIERTFVGSRIVHHRGVAAYPEAQREYGKGRQISGYREGSVESNGVMLGQVTVGGESAFTTSTLIPLFDLEVDSFGNYGNNIGLRLMAPTTIDASPTDEATVTATRSFIYRLQALEKPSNSTTPTILANQIGDLSLDVSFREDAVHPRTNNSIYAGKSFVKSYQLLNDPQLSDEYGPFGRMHVYQENITNVLSMLTQGYKVTTDLGEVEVSGEAEFDLDAEVFGRAPEYGFSDPRNIHMFNLFTGVDYNGTEYFSVDVRNSTSFGGISFENNTVHYATGGSDGLWYYSDGRPAALANTRMYDEIVRSKLMAFGQYGYHYLDMNRYPFTSFIDSGFSLETKLQFPRLLSLRKDWNVIVGTQATADATGPEVPQGGDDGVTMLYQDGVIAGGVLGTSNELIGNWEWCDLNTDDVEQSIGLSLRTQLNLNLESELFGTPVLRGLCIGHGGQLIDESFEHNLPLTHEVASFISAYMGAPAWRTGQGFDKYPNNTVKRFTNCNITYRNIKGYNKTWDNGINWVQYFDDRQLFFPALQTAYPYDTSVLNGVITMFACCTLERIANNVWKYLTGRSDLTDDQFVTEADALVEEMTAGIFDDRFVVQPESFYTAADVARGYSWRTRIHLYANNMKTVGRFDIVAHRMSDLNEEA